MSLREGQSNEYSYHIGNEFFADRGADIVIDADVAVHLDITARRGMYLLQFDFVGRLDVPCDRCLQPVAVDVDTEYDLTVRHGEELDDSSDEVLVIPESWSRLDVAPMIYDTLLLSIPLRCVHAEGGCDSEMAAALRDHRAGDDAPTAAHGTYTTPYAASAASTAASR